MAFATSTTDRSPHQAAWCSRTSPSTILINSRVAGTAFKAVQDHGDEALDALPGCALEDPDDGDRQARLRRHLHGHRVAGLRRLRRYRVLHEKRPALIPILDNEAIFDAYMLVLPPVGLVVLDQPAVTSASATTSMAVP